MGLASLSYNLFSQIRFCYQGRDSEHGMVNLALTENPVFGRARLLSITIDPINARVDIHYFFGRGSICKTTSKLFKMVSNQVYIIFTDAFNNFQNYILCWKTSDVHCLSGYKLEWN